MDSVSGGKRPRLESLGYVGRSARLRAGSILRILALAAALSAGTLALAQQIGPARAQDPPDCAPGTLPFHAQFAFPLGAFDPDDLPLELPDNISIVVVPGTASSPFDLVIVTACITPPPATPPVTGGAIFTTPTPRTGSPVLAFLTPTATSTTAPATATSQATAAASAATPATVSGIRPPSTGDGGLLRAPGAPASALYALLALSGGLAIAGASLLRDGAGDSGRGGD